MTHLDVNDLLDAIANDLDTTLLLLLVQCLELPLLLPVVKGANHNLRRKLSGLEEES